ncbi:MAG TPA: hypothetical protein P5200_14280 [Tenuifilaceae bacterium]|nr:hypothetical protein [Tenuifilaceae bacterium]
MRKTVMVVVMLFFVSQLSVFAQMGGGEKPAGTGLITFELTGSPFNSDEALLTPGVFRARYFVMDNIAARLSTWFDMTSNRVVPETVYNYSYFSLRPGGEFHMPGTSKVDPYVGGELIFDGAGSSKNTEVGAPITGAWNTNLSNRGFFRWGMAAVAGADYYMGGGFYIGIEVGLEFARTGYAEVKVGDDLFAGKTAKNSFNTVLTNSFRFGYAFR